MQQFIGLGHPEIFELLSLFGDTWGVLYVPALALWLWGRRVCYPVLAAVALAAPTKELLTILFGVARPSGPEIVVYEHLDIKSFPSGHVYQLLAPWAMLRAFGGIPWYVPAILTVAVGVSRLYLGTHYFGDVFFAIVFALLLVWALYKAWPHLEKRLAALPFRFYIIGGIVLVAGTAATIIMHPGNPRRYEVVGLALGMAAGLLLEYTYVRYEPLPSSTARKIVMALVGLAGIVLFFVLDRLAPQDTLYLGLFTASAAALWCFVGAPLLFQRLGWAGRLPRRNESMV